MKHDEDLVSKIIVGVVVFLAWLVLQPIILGVNLRDKVESWRYRKYL